MTLAGSRARWESFGAECAPLPLPVGEGGYTRTISGQERNKTGTQRILENYFDVLLRAFGPQGWWPARTRFEVALGAILTQHTAWKNVVLAMRQLKKANLLAWKRLRTASVEEIQSCIRPAGFYQQKARTIKKFVDWFEREYAGSFDILFAKSREELRNELLSLNGLGPETVDAILLYAGKKPSFVADAYTRRILGRHGWISPDAGYAETQAFLHCHLPEDADLFNEFHALLVETAKRCCHATEALCGECPLSRFLTSGHPVGARAGITRPQGARAYSQEGRQTA